MCLLIRQDLGYNDGYGGYGPYGLAYQAQGQPPPPPPPLHPSQLNGNGNVDPYNRGLNVTDPRFAAKYGNPYLRTSPTTGGPVNGSPMMSGPGRYNTQQQQQPRQYATLYGGRNNGSYSPVHGAGYATMAPGVGKGSNPVKAKLPHNYAGTMLGNGGSGNGVRSSGGKNKTFADQYFTFQCKNKGSS